ncbi:hypothetical protein MVLG_03966 [Microbotryum lychnidis-dioicae p1A1 Lamole]|uniref:NADH dehydrogenase n=2 Tax=Microbotryum TaxID=34416 RepID=U5H9S8_USTV1|nr:hypothetical protein MVLG_03966 [Microbotryum lychnidis-dioicae p1A1 Lamole]SGY15080.1 BQ5605_C013g07237 [Microbotryum silenes-dioicae]|eukprot:KDE05733.1 hypothetical protein MVLG_03966 [Microbotryum lychnidis-dioicae p1A1 Lamole]
MSAPPSGIPSNYADIIASREEKIRQSWINVMEARLVREELQKCWRTEGVNHYEQCYDLAQKYLTLLRTSKIEGFRKLDFES